MLADDSLKENPQRRPANRLRGSWVLWPLAAAALMVISVGLFDHFGGRSSSVAVASVLPVGLEADLISRHDHCCQAENHQGFSVSRDDDAGIVAAMHLRLNQPVLMYRPKDSNWTFRGASICPVGSTPSGHLVFADGTDRLSIFSLPKSVLPGTVEGSEFSTTLDNHRIVGFVKDDALFFAVESGNTISLDQLHQMTTDMKPAVAFTAMPVGGGLAVTELLHPIATMSGSEH